VKYLPLTHARALAHKSAGAAPVHANTDLYLY